MDNSPQKMTVSRDVYNCPACGATVVGRLSVEVRGVELNGDETDKTVNMAGRIVGATIEKHDCAPKVTRDRAATPRDRGRPVADTPQA